MKVEIGDTVQVRPTIRKGRWAGRSGKVVGIERRSYGALIQVEFTDRERTVQRTFKASSLQEVGPSPVAR